ncbi:AbrB/MazE/SpoVT family DNA-binding domain-containing protein [Bacillus aquiflavi]|uniref:AbrB/MazE/SpoVT family DNA-binding domain-containing protein n=1 Tax=Bacillus aquiflavi TaxID=2672567 RepID=A0A6B3VUK0_9BACI|nr:AbrB/MazE/SpoVT family DNA-binding domain-containing protein [Bacillus aquiflavi]MBA4536551.1 AbrB/MazE/SpoVT family DNA-binding domain-containing protein [Bacillus aquiflavi]NEY80918.1 AbrB/MazE/SpoVT family DNA-binding domain-containing protein [Bacillus aquiflavi]UAC49636.1 AbrB/MazE/SpoVT family DNA-binding domain-containing protein [Bacillus aquiflavi]
MKPTGIVRKIDELGRIVIPVELRRSLSLEIKDPIEIFVDDDKIILRKYVVNNACDITGIISNDNVSLVNGKISLSREGAEILLKELQNIKN